MGALSIKPLLIGGGERGERERGGRKGEREGKGRERERAEEKR